MILDERISETALALCSGKWGNICSLCRGKWESLRAM